MAEVDYSIAKFLGDNWFLIIIALIALYYFKKVFNDLRHRYFAWFMYIMTKEKSKKIEEMKGDHFSSLSSIVSNNPELRKENAIKILEIGVGTGTNFAHYPQNCRLVVVDPNPHFASYYNDNRTKFGNIHSEEIIVCGGEDMDMVESNSIDVVVMTLVLCSVTDVKQCLKQIIRVLTPGGKFFFIEHVRDFDSEKHGTRQKIQDFLTTFQIWPTLFDGCYLDRKTLEMVKDAGFSSVEGEHLYVPLGQLEKTGLGPSIQNFIFQVVTPHAKGIATK
ncbi:unnamed protein product [Meganyctiphanes norvegica]|uniref:Methyltransferase type 11 domain-containing protein n=1 Tax=Meganyctiphanes norvegica TaxID=48144 RepID=A0AAV2Q2Q2_MEGNR